LLTQKMASSKSNLLFLGFFHNKHIPIVNYIFLFYDNINIFLQISLEIYVNEGNVFLVHTHISFVDATLSKHIICDIEIYLIHV